ncbi:CitMHS family transporter [Luteimonas marina]|uniref:CitMHS family transporter n=1 Tax=Luteimonas marina TaxID=488485 RepID=A0A5C5TT92_9GAMM|nr:CitMHS family transporter [Luteimonas marina]TWT17453.1 CitMHS family transporter [Luteimonas marina]
MLTLLGFGMVIVFMTLIMTKRLSPLVALITIPILFALVGGFGGPELGKMMLEGIKTLAPTGVMLMFAILYFGIMIDAGLFDPVIRRIVKAVGGDPLKVVVGTAILAAFVSLDGDGSTTYMITVAAMLPLYRRLGMDALNLTCVTILAGGVMNLTPWGGPLARAASALHVDPSDVFVPMIPAMVVGVVGVIGLAYVLGKRERLRVGTIDLHGSPEIQDSALLPSDDGEHLALKRPRLLWVNALLTAALMVCLVLGVLPLSVLFMVAFSIAVVINYPCVKLQRERVSEHAKNALPVVAVIFAAGVFTGILSGTGMVDAMSGSFLAVIPDTWGPYLASITALASMPFTFFISNDAFYYGVLPIVSQAAEAYGITPVEMARASLIGQPVHLLSPLVPSTYLLVGLAGVEFGDHQKFTLKWAVLICLLMMATAMACAVFPLVR